MLRDGEYHIQYWASMFGSFHWETKTDLDEFGVPTKEAIPQLTQLYTDLKTSIPTFTSFKPENPNWQNLVLQEEDRFEHVLVYHETTHETCKVVDTSRPIPNPEGFSIDTVGIDKYQCPECGRKFIEPHGLSAHRVNEHHYRVPEGIGIVDNRCPKCNKQLANKTCCIRHIRSNQRLWEQGLPCSEKKGGPGTARSLRET